MNLLKKIVIFGLIGALIVNNASAMLKPKDDTVFLPEEIIQEILLFVAHDGKNLIKCLVVCKPWNNIIKNHYEFFVSSILQSSPNLNTILLRTQDQRVIKSIIKTFSSEMVSTIIKQRDNDGRTTLGQALRNGAGDESCLLLITNGVEVSESDLKNIICQHLLKSGLALTKNNPHMPRREPKDAFCTLVKAFSIFNLNEKKFALDWLNHIVYDIKPREGAPSISNCYLDMYDRIQQTHAPELNMILSYAIKYKKNDLAWLLANSGYTVPENHENYDQLPTYIKVLLAETNKQWSCQLQ